MAQARGNRSLLRLHSSVTKAIRPVLRGRELSTSAGGEHHLGGFCSLLAFPGLNQAQNIKPEDLKGKVVLLVNTASYCGYTPQLAGLQSLHDRYACDGLVILAVPSNDFGAQEPDGEEAIHKFYTDNYKVTFPITSKQRVIGSDCHPAFAWLSSTLGDAGTPSWNFGKWLVGRGGDLVALFAPAVDPLDATVTQAIESELGIKKQQ